MGLGSMLGISSLVGGAGPVGPIGLGTSAAGGLSSLLNPAGPIGGLLGAGGLSNILFGKQQAPLGFNEIPMSDIEKAAKQNAAQVQDIALTQLKEQLKEDPTKIAKEILAQRSKGFQASRNQIAKDLASERRALQGQIARQGLSGSSIGLSARTGAERRAGEALRQLAFQETAQPGLSQIRRDVITQRLAPTLGLSAQSLSALPQLTLVPQQRAQRTGGIAPLLGAGLGGLLSGGSPAGVTAGLGVGQAAQSIYG